MRGDDEVVQRVIGAVRQIVDHELAVATGQHQGFDQVLGNLSHEDVAAPAHEHSAHRPSQYQWSLASTTISPRFSIITPGLRSAARGVPGLHRRRAHADVRRLGVVRRRRLLDPARGARRPRARWQTCRPADPCRAPSDATVASSPRRTMRWRWPAASSSPCWITTTGWYRRRSSGWRASRRRPPASVDYVYSDEAHVLADGRESAHFLKPDWSPERFRSSMYTCHLSVLRRDVVDRSRRVPHRLRRVAGPRPDPARDGVDRRARPPGGAPPVPDRTTGATSPARCRGRRRRLNGAVARGRQAVQEQCDRLGIDADVVHGAVEGTYRLLRSVPAEQRSRRGAPRAGEGAPIAPVPTRRGRRRCDALRTTHRDTRLVLAYPEPPRRASRRRARRRGGRSRWELLPVPTASGRSPPPSTGRSTPTRARCWSRSRPASSRSDLTPDWLETLAGLALSPGTGLVGGA